MNFVPQDPAYIQRVKNSFAKQTMMKSLGISLGSVGAGKIILEMPFDQRWTQQHGFIHAGAVTTALDSACGYAAFSLMPSDAAVLSVEFKTNLLRPAKGDRFEFIGSVIKAGQTVTVCEGKAYAYVGTDRKLIATMTGTMMTLLDRDIKG